MTSSTRWVPGVVLVSVWCAFTSACGSSEDKHGGGTGGSAGTNNGTGGATGASGGAAGSMNQAGTGGTQGGARGGNAGGSGHAGDVASAGKGGDSAGSGDSGRGGTTGDHAGQGGTGQGGQVGGSPSAGSETGGSATAGEGGASGAAPSCMDLQMQYSDELTKAKACDPSASTPQCQAAVPAPLGCNTCSFIVNDSTKLFAIKAAYEDQACEAHMCPQFVCMPTEYGLCMGSGSEGTCQDRQP